MNEGLGSWTGRRRRKSGSKPAIIFDGAATTYAELDARSGRLAGAFAAAGVRAGDRVAYLGDNHPSFLECLFATAWLGAIFVPLNTRLAAPELNFILRDSGATILITSAAHAGLGAVAATDSAVHRRLLAGRPDRSFAAVPTAARRWVMAHVGVTPRPRKSLRHLSGQTPPTYEFRPSLVSNRSTTPPVAIQPVWPTQMLRPGRVHPRRSSPAGP